MGRVGVKKKPNRRKYPRVESVLVWVISEIQPDSTEPDYERVKSGRVGGSNKEQRKTPQTKRHPQKLTKKIKETDSNQREGDRKNIAQIQMKLK